MFSILSFSFVSKALKVMNKELLHFLKEINGNTCNGDDISMKQTISHANIEKLENMKSKLAKSLQHTSRSVSICTPPEWFI